MLSNTLCDVILQIHLVHTNTWLILLGRVPATGIKKPTHFCSGKFSECLLLLLHLSVCRAVVSIWVTLSMPHLVRMDPWCFKSKDSCTGTGMFILAAGCKGNICPRVQGSKTILLSISLWKYEYCFQLPHYWTSSESFNTLNITTHTTAKDLSLRYILLSPSVNV